MEENVGDTDSLVRIVLGALLGLASLLILAQEQGMVNEIVSAPAIASPILGVMAIILLATGFSSKCALYSALGMDTR